MYYLGIDAGGSKTDAVIVDDQGQKVGEGHAGEANFHNVGIEKAVTSVFIAVKEALGIASLGGSEIAASCLGIASYDTPRDKIVIGRAFDSERANLFGGNLTIVNDAVIGLYAGTTPPGVALISGTGCNCYCVGPEGEEAFAGNWSSLLSDEGGSYKLALRILAAIMRAFDGRGAKTILRELVLSELAVSDEMAMMDWIYSQNPTIAEISKIAALLDEALKERDGVAQELFNEQIEILASAVSAVVRRVAMAERAFDLVLIGSFFKTARAVEALEPKIKVFAPKITLVYPKVSAAVGATILARNKWKEKFHLPTS